MRRFAADELANHRGQAVMWWNRDYTGCHQRSECGEALGLERRRDDRITALHCRDRQCGNRGFKN